MCLDFVNTLDDRYSDKPKELLTRYLDLTCFAEDTQIMSELDLDRLSTRSMQAPQPAAEALKVAIEMREAMYAVFWALHKRKPVAAGDLQVLNGFIQEAAQHFTLVPARGHFEWKLDPHIDFLAPLWPIARSAGELLASDRLQYLRACASKTCEWLFLDESKNHRRRWCDMTKCGNRAKAKRFYDRTKEASG